MTCTVYTVFPSMTCGAAAIALLASFKFLITINPNPLDLPVSKSCIHTMMIQCQASHVILTNVTRALSTIPNLVK